MVAVKFPDFEVSFLDGKTMKLPIRVSDLTVDSDKSSVPKASLVCLSFRASSHVMDHGNDKLLGVYLFLRHLENQKVFVYIRFLKWNLVNIRIVMTLL